MPLKLGQIMSQESADLVARAGRGQGAATRRLDVDLIKADGTSLPVRILHRLARSSGQACALVLNRAERTQEALAQVDQLLGHKEHGEERVVTGLR